MLRPMNCFSVSVSLLFFVSYVQLLLFELDTAGAAYSDENVDRRRPNLRQGRNGVDNNYNGGNDTTVNDGRSLIVGGRMASDFPRSVVFLSDRVDALQCGGTLISPTVVLAAGHCEISLVHEAVFLRFESDKKENNEIRIKATQEILHPKYNRKNLQNDVMLIVLEKSPNEVDGVEVSPPIVPYMKLHSPEDKSLEDMLKEIEINKPNNSGRSLVTGISTFKTPPAPKTTDLRLRALGWGHTADGNKGSPSKILKEVSLNWVLNEECEKSQESDFVNYNNRITDDMMCTWRSGMDTCHGDSGGPIVVDNPNYQKDENHTDFKFLQVGIISWGEDCADHVFPGVASRVAVAYDWIRDRVCSIDGDAAPAYLECDNEHTFSPAPSTSPTTREDAIEAELRTEALAMVNDVPAGSTTNANAMTIEVAVEIYLDVYAFETSWTLIELDTGAAVKHVPYREYKYENSVREVFDLTMGKSYRFTIYDQFGDGIRSEGSYRIFLVDDSKYESVGAILLEDDGDFGSKRSQTFQVPRLSIPNPMPRRDQSSIQKNRARNRIGILGHGILSP